MAYTPSFTPRYPEWQDRPSEDTPADALAFTKYDQAIKNIEDFLDGSTAVKPVARDASTMTQAVGVGSDGKLYTRPGSGGGGGASTAAEVSYDNTTSHMTATDVQAAIDELKSSGGGTASGTSYDNTQSGLTADDVQEAIDELASDFQDGCDTIVQAVTAKGQTPASNSPADIAIAIGNISTSGISVISRAAWEALSTAQKQSYGMVGIQDASSGFERGELVYGADYVPPFLQMVDYTTDIDHTFTISSSGLYLVLVAVPYQASGSITLPQGATILSTIDESAGETRHVYAYIAELNANDTVSTHVMYDNFWPGRIAAVIRLNEINSVQDNDFVSTADGTVTFTLPNNNNLYLVYGLAVSRQDGVSADNSTNTSGEQEMITGNWGFNSVSRVAVCRGNASPNYSFYGYDGGFSAVISWQIS